MLISCFGLFSSFFGVRLLLCSPASLGQEAIFLPQANSWEDRHRRRATRQNWGSVHTASKACASVTSSATRGWASSLCPASTSAQWLTVFSLSSSIDWRLCGGFAGEQTGQLGADPQAEGVRRPLLGILGWVHLSWSVSWKTGASGFRLIPVWSSRFGFVKTWIFEARSFHVFLSRPVLKVFVPEIPLLRSHCTRHVTLWETECCLEGAGVTLMSAKHDTHSIAHGVSPKPSSTKPSFISKSLWLSVLPLSAVYRAQFYFARLRQ